MSVNGLKEIEELGDKIVAALNADKKVAKIKRHAKYRQKRIAEATVLWDEYNKKILEVKAAIKGDDPCLTALTTKYGDVYKEYTDRLLQTAVLNPGGDSDASDDDAVTDKYQIQLGRFDTLQRILYDVEAKRDGEEPPSAAFISIKSKRINELWQRIELEEENLKITSEQPPENYIADYEQLENDMEMALMFLHENAAATTTNKRYDGVKLGRMELPKFSGDYFTWVTFRDLFQSLVIKEKNGYSKCQQMQLLKTHVTGEAERLIRDLTISEANFDGAWQRLMKRFDNERVVVSKMINKLMNQPQCKRDAKAIKNLLDTTDQVILALNNMNRPVNQWDDWIVVLITQKLSEESHKDWEQEIGNSTNLPTWLELKEFLEKHFRMLERIEGGNKRGENKTFEKPKTPLKAYQTSLGTSCVVCNEDHTLYKCPTWFKMEPQARWAIAKKQKWCFLCLKSHPGKKKCDRPKPCKKCDRNHSTWLHPTEGEGQELVATHRTITSTGYDTLLATAVIRIKDIDGCTVILRALIDSGSEGSMITEEAASRLQFKNEKSDKWIAGLNGNKSGLLKRVNLCINPRFNARFSMNVKFYILKTLTKTLPSHDLSTTSWKHIKDLVWADPKFNKRGKIDALLGMDVIVEILKGGLIKGLQGQPMAQETELGWIMSGNIDPQYHTREVKCFVSTKEEDDHNLQRFWELEELNPTRALTANEVECEQFYQDTYTQAKDGSFVVKIPFRTGDKGPEQLGESRGQAMARFLQLEKKLARDDELKKEYVKVIREYIDLGHARDVTTQPSTDKKYYIPHHAVVKPESLTTKTRVVFDASAKTTNGRSLNECMHIGAKQQRDLLEILLKWRIYKVVYKADVEKMYRMIKLDNEDQKYHTFVWRDDPTKPIQEYQMTAVTFGTAAAPFLATRTLKQIASNIKETYPLAAACLEEDFYVDDLIGGSHTVDEAINCKDEIITALSQCKFSLRKWTSNSSAVLESLPAEMTEKSLQIFTDKETTKALGLIWVPQADVFKFSCNWTTTTLTSWTKRQFLSEASKIFDPLGWLAPVTVNAKLMMQEIWQSKIGWDDQVPENINQRWRQFRDELGELERIMIDRWISYEPGCTMSLHGFSDASEKAYSAVIYARISTNSNVTTQLLVSKTRVAPLTTKITLPRLELCGAVLTANLMNTVSKALKMDDIPKYLWTDSMITLGWINGEPQRWKTFVANRVAEIQSCHMDEVRYVPSEQNPADCASRGLMPAELPKFELWWKGPTWLAEEQDQWPKAEVTDHDLEQRNQLAVNVAQFGTNDTVNVTSSWNKLKRIAAYCRRFKTKNRGKLTAVELQGAEVGLIKRVQEEVFPAEMEALVNQKSISKRSCLKSLNVFLDADWVMRVGGRLTNANLSENTKHPMVLPAGRDLTKIIIHQAHIDSIHGGPKLMRSLLLKKYWILQSKRMVQNEYKQCINCRRFNAASYQQRMGDLPQARVTLTRVFHETGLDYAGPIEVKSSNLRSAKSQKGYVAVFICMSTKAVHLELVSDQTSEAFLASFNRFVARRGLPASMYSDNGTTFVGASNLLDKHLIQQRNQEIANRMVVKGVEWHFIPEGGPNFGGLWERAVRSMKDHVKRTLKTARLTLEEYSTLLCQVEACMNSRPLCALSNNLEDMDALTPGHFLIGTSLLAPPDSTIGITKINDHKRWRYVQLLQRQLWERWHKEYLVELQQRHKWQDTSANARKGELVVVRDEDLPPRNWLLGRIEELHPGDDGQVRVATIRIANNVASGNKLLPKKDWLKWLHTPTKTSTIRRPIRKLCPLTITAEEQPLVDEQKKKKSQQVQPGQRILRTRTKQGLNVALTLLGICLLCLPVMTDPIKDCVKLMPFQNNAGIYFENLGRASMTRSEWNMVVYFDLRKYYYELEQIDDAAADLRALCSGVAIDSTGTQCKSIVELLKWKLDEVHHMNVLLKMNKQASEPIRSKRAAPLNIVGWIGHELFGIMDAERAEILENKITNLQTRQGYVTDLIRNQTSIVELTINLMKSSNEDIMKGLGSLTNAIDLLKNETELVRRKEAILGWAMYTSLLIGRIEQIQRNIVHMLTDLQQGHVSSYLFTPKQFKQQLDNINDQIPSGSKLPLDPQHDMRSFYEVMRGRMRVTERNILLEIILPLVSIAEFQVFYLIPVPFQHNGEHMSIIPDSKYLLITLQRDMFYQMDDHDLHECIKPQGVPIICQSKRPMNNVQSNKNKCERELLAKATGFSSHCRINVTQVQDSWIQLKEKNMWIYGLQNKTTLNVVYASEVDTVTLQGSGKMELSPGCEVVQHGFTMIGQTKVVTKGSMDFQPTGNLSEFLHSHPLELKLVNITTDHGQQMKELYSLVNHVRTSSEETQTRQHWQLGFTITILVIIFGIIIGAIKTGIVTIIWLKCQQRNRETSLQNGSQPLPIEADKSVITELNEISVDVHQATSSTATRHGPGGCPFRT